MHKLKKILFLCLMITTFSVEAANQVHANANIEPLDRVVAVINSEVITQSQLDKQIEVAKGQLQASGTPIPDEAQLQKQVLNQMIDQNIELQMAKRFGIDITETELNTTLKGIAKRNNMTLTQLRTAVTSHGVTWTDYRKQIKDQMLINEVLQRAVGSQINITPQEIKNVMDSPDFASRNVSQYHVADILIALPDEPTSQQLQQANQVAQDLIKQLNNGANFKELAAANSNSNTALSGGDLGWTSPEELPTVFASKVSTMKPGQVAGPIRTGNGLHIIKLLDVKQKNGEHYITETNVRHILIATKSPSDSKAAKAQIEVIRKQIVSGQSSFATMAKKYSQDPISAAKGGNLGWVTPGILVAPFENVMNSLKVDQISQPVKTEYGWHLIEVLGRKKVNDTEKYQQAEVKKMIYQRKFEEQAQSWVERMKDASYIKIMLNDNA